MALLELRAVEAGYGSIQILHGVSLHVNAGEVVAVIGPNGAGKSTAFKVIMGFITYLRGGYWPDPTRVFMSVRISDGESARL